MKVFERAAPQVEGPTAPAGAGSAPVPRKSPILLAWSIITVIIVGAVAVSALFIATTRNWTPGALAAGVPPLSRTVNITLDEFRVNMSEVTLPAGKVTLKIKNTGTIQHELVVFRLSVDPSQLPMTSGNLNEDGPGVSDVSDGDNLNPGQSVSRPADFTPGTYLFVCNLPGHMMAGMQQIVTVK
jgi:uncharacterized cupredoxin-like copper-binding protein